MFFYCCMHIQIFLFSHHCLHPLKSTQVHLELKKYCQRFYFLCFFIISTVAAIAIISNTAATAIIITVFLFLFTYFSSSIILHNRYSSELTYSFQIKALLINNFRPFRSISQSFNFSSLYFAHEVLLT